MSKKLTWCNGYRYGNMPITSNMARVVLRQVARESMQCQRRAFHALFNISNAKCNVFSVTEKH
ncbi:Uncharacterised protein [Yersinia frederiksenii]|nr:Uncharacterised protein [Yersinia frederiksenii]CNC10295.1 Uncharacterised protein [Yersinia frederiksenii]CNI27282.1 Uncharacterised protein [Yersinia frederiksenii]CNK67688.1 Uncharacterised protein [Yersinia frederiksenii]CNL54762.1 Uncharacterised protein [Yersinia frederiksenii]